MSAKLSSRVVLKDKYFCSEPGCDADTKAIVCFSSTGKNRGTFWQCTQGHVNKGRLKKQVEVAKD